MDLDSRRVEEAVHARNLVAEREARSFFLEGEHHSARRLVNREILVEALVHALFAVFAGDLTAMRVAIAMGRVARAVTKSRAVGR